VRILDMHSHWGTRRGYPFQTPEELAQQEKVFHSAPSYVTEQRTHGDVILGNWLHIDPRAGRAAVDEFDRCLTTAAGFIGLGVPGAGFNVAASDRRYRPLYERCIDARAPS
jgi:predicted TIM-barrel fold metal-dependent hydrolase